MRKYSYNHPNKVEKSKTWVPQMAIQTGVVQFHRYHCLSACSLGTWQKGIADIKSDLIAKNHTHNNYFFCMLFMGRDVFTKLRFGSG